MPTGEKTMKPKHKPGARVWGTFNVPTQQEERWGRLHFDYFNEGDEVMIDDDVWTVVETGTLYSSDLLPNGVEQTSCLVSEKGKRVWWRSRFLAGYLKGDNDREGNFLPGRSPVARVGKEI
jgi:hypothetical protein